MSTTAVNELADARKWTQMAVEMASSHKAAERRAKFVWGERCRKHDPDCVICAVWDELDRLGRPKL